MKAQGVAAELPSATASASQSGKQSATQDADGVYNVGGDVRPPVVLSSVDPKFTEQARKKKISGDVQVSLIVDAEGLPQNVHVVKGIGMGLDEKALEAVRGYRFKPALKDGIPVPVRLLINVNFRIF